MECNPHCNQGNEMTENNMEMFAISYGDKVMLARTQLGNLIGEITGLTFNLSQNLIDRQPLQDDEDDQLQEINDYLRRASENIQAALRHAGVGQ
jgi:hypothetical protein